MYSFEFQYAGFHIDAAQDEDGNVWISTPTVESVLQYRANSTREIVASKSFNDFVGKDFALGKKRSKSTKYNTTNLYYSKETFLKIVYFELQKGNQAAINLVLSGFISDFEGSIQSALGNQLTEEKREYLRQLVHDRLQAFRGWTDIIQAQYIRFYGVKPEGWYYGKLVKQANLELFGVPDFGSDRTANMTEEQQKLIKDFETFIHYAHLRKPTLEPEALLRFCIDAFVK